jgi:hypothetical protein
MRVFSLCAALVAITIVPAWAHEASRGGVTVAHPWARATPAGASVGAAYLEIKAADGVVDRLIGASSEVAGRTEIHTHIEEAGVMKMRRVDGIAVKSGGSHLLMPRGDHVMLMDLKAPLKEGELIKLRLVFEKAGPIDVEATVEPVGAMGPHGMDHQPGHEMPATGKAGKPSHHHGH